MASKPKAAKDTEADDAEVVEDADGESGEPKRKLPLKLILVAVAGLVVLGGGGAAAFMFLHHPNEEKPAPVAVAKPVVFLDMPEVLVNLSNTGSDRTQYLKVKVVLELSDQALSQQIQPVMPRLMDTFQTYLRELRPTDLDGSAGLYRLKEELTRRVNIAIAPNHVNAVLFKEIVVQ